MGFFLNPLADPRFQKLLDYFEAEALKREQEEAAEVVRPAGRREDPQDCRKIGDFIPVSALPELGHLPYVKVPIKADLNYSFDLSCAVSECSIRAMVFRKMNSEEHGMVFVRVE